MVFKNISFNTAIAFIAYKPKRMGWATATALTLSYYSLHNALSKCNNPIRLNYHRILQAEHRRSR